MPAEQILGKGDRAYAVPFYGHTRPLLVDLVLREDGTNDSRHESIVRQGTKLIGKSFSPKLRNGNRAHLWAVAALLCDGSGRMVGAIESVHDVTEQQRAEDRQALSLQQLDGVNRLQETLLLPGSLEEKLKQIVRTASHSRPRLLPHLDGSAGRPLPERLHPRRRNGGMPSV